MPRVSSVFTHNKGRRCAPSGLWMAVDYLLWYMRGESIAKAFEVAQTFKHPIDKYHFELMESVTVPNGVTLAKPLFDPKIAL